MTLLAQISLNPKLIKICQEFKEHFHNPVSVLYPCCSIDASPSQVFSNVTYIDHNVKMMDLMEKAGFKTVCEDISDYKPREEHDLVLLVKPDLKDIESATKHAKTGGYLLLDSQYTCSSWPGSDAWLLKKPDAEKLSDKRETYSLEGRILVRDKEVKVDRTNLNQSYIFWPESCWAVFRKK